MVICKTKEQLDKHLKVVNAQIEKEDYQYVSLFLEDEIPLMITGDGEICAGNTVISNLKYN